MGFFSTFGRLPHTWLNLVLTLVAGVTQGVGIVLFIPVLKLMDGSAGDLPKPFLVVRDVLAAVGLPFNLPVLLVAIVVFIIAGLGLNFAQRCLLQGYSWMHYVRRTRSIVIESLLDAQWHYSAKQATGKTVNRLTEEVTRSGAALTQQVAVVAAALQIAVFLLLGMTLSWELLVLAVVFGAGAVFAVRPLRRRAVAIGENLSLANDAMSYRVVDYLTNVKLVKVTGTERQVAGRIDLLQNTVADLITAKHVNLAATYFISQVFPVLLVATVILVAQDFLSIDPSSTLVFLLFLARAAPLMTQLQQAYQSYSIEQPALRGVDAFIAESRAHSETAANGTKAFTELRDGISFENVTYRFPEADKATLTDITLRIGRGQMVALVGSSGGGKSTLIDLLCGLRRPDKGQILVDGEDLRTLDMHTWRRRIGYVTQDIVVFNESLRDNILFVHPEGTERDIRRVVDIAHLRDVVEELPQGLDTVLGEGGVRLSGGQKQRLALARALIGDPQVLLLDEATSALDTESERMIQKAIESIAHRFTIVIVAHRLSTVRKADRICVMERGRIVESGVYDDLLARNGRFAELHEHQFA